MQRNPLSAYSPKSFLKKREETYRPQKNYSLSSHNFWWKKILIISLCSLFILVMGGGFLYLQIRILKHLPDVRQIKDIQLTQATVITDRNGVELYKIFDENREYVTFENISKHMIDAIVAVEDQRYWEHEGLDPMGIFRAGFMTMLGRNWGWGSTLTQQLITNLMKLERPFHGSFLDKVDYKLTQIILAKRLNNVLQQQIKAENSNLSSTEVKHKMKEKIIELYLNYVFLGNNAYGVEAASKTYFNKSAKDLTVMEASILASIPKAPSRYDPYKSSALMWSFTIKDAAGKEYPYEWNIKASILSKFRENITSASFSNKKTAESFVRFVNSLSPSSLTLDGKVYNIQYSNGRAEFALGRMYEDWKITEEELKSAFIESLTKTFEKSTFDIKAPHFVFWIKDLLEKEYGSGSTKKWGLVVKTTLDYNIQQLAEAAVKAHSASLFEYGASNSSLIYTDSTNGDVLAYLGSLDYFNKDIQGQNDMARNPRQSGSSIKPLIYALGFEKLPLTIDTPIYDIPFKAGKDSPNNADGKFNGSLPLKKALGFSRNIPAVKMFFALGGESVAKPFLQKLGLSGVKNEIEYWYPLALGAAEVSMIELAGAYQHLSTATPAQINPILEIKANDGSIIYKKTPVVQENIIKPGIITLMWHILSEPSNRIWAWATKFNVKWLTYALKTWTSNVKTDKGSRPRDGWFAAYTPSKVLLMWAGNADARPMNSKAYWGSIHADSVKKFLSDMLAKGYITNEEMPNKDTSSISISSVSWKLPSEATPVSLVTKTLGWNWLLPKETEWPISEIEIDTSCFGKVSPFTPADQIKKWYLITPTSFMPNNMDLEDIKKYLTEQVQQTWATSALNLFMSEPENYCPDRQPVTNDEIKISIVRPNKQWAFAKKNTVTYSISSPTNIKKVIVTLDNNTIASYIDNSSEVFGSRSIDLSAYADGNHQLGVTAVDVNNLSQSVQVAVNLVSEDTTPPTFNKSQSKVVKNADGSYDANLLFDDAVSAVKEGKVFEKGQTKALTTFSMQVAQFITKVSEVSVEVKDMYGNTLKQDINLETFNQTQE